MNPVKTISVKTTSAITDNDEILARRVAFRTERSAEGPQVRDFIITDDGTPGGTERRVAHDWGKDIGLQPTSGGPDRSF